MSETPRPDPWDDVRDCFDEFVFTTGCHAINAARAADQQRIADLEAQVEAQAKRIEKQRLRISGRGEDITRLEAERDTLRAERDAAQQAHSELASLVGAALVYATLDSAAGERPATEPDHALTETVWKLVQQRGRMESALATVRDCIIALTPGHRTGYDWNTDPLYLTRKEGQALAAIDAALSSSPRPQESQP